MKALLAVMLLAACEKAKPPIDARPIDAVVETTDLVIMLDVSKSMEDDDLEPYRFQAAKEAVGRVAAPYQLVVFAMEAKTGVELATLHMDDIPALGCAMGDALALAVEQLAASTATHKVIVLIADGPSNLTTTYTLDAATDLAKARGVTVSPILIGRDHDGGDPMLVVEDPAELQRVAARTGGVFHRATDNAALDAALAKLTAR